MSPLLAMSIELADALWIVAVGSMSGAACALVGSYLVLRRLSLLGDALSHAVLPGLVLAFLLGGQVNIGTMLLGALVVGLLTTALIEVLERYLGVSSDAGLGIVFTGLFAVGVLLIDRYADAVDLDADCVLFGLLEFVPLSTVAVGPWQVPRAAVSMAPVLVLDALCVVLLWKEWKLLAFDPALATASGFSARLLHYLLMALVATTTVASFEAVGSIVVIAMLVAPAAAAHLLTDRLGRLMALAVTIAVFSATAGYGLARHWDTNTAGMIGVVAGAVYATAAVAAPRYGLLSRLWQAALLRWHILCDDLLAMLFRVEELAVGKRLTPVEARNALGGGPGSYAALLWLERQGKLRHTPDGLELTPPGRTQASSLVRAHRLWESYLVAHLGLPADHVHDPAERMEHYLSEELQQQIAADLGSAASDPHGREIPER